MSTLISAIGWIHVAASSFSMLIGAIILFRTKGTMSHRRQGRWYFYAMIVTNVTALMIYRTDVFFFPHWLAVATLAIIAVGYWAITAKSIRSWLTVHLTCMIVSYYMLAGGAVNEAFLRIAALKPYGFDNETAMPHPTVGIAHSVVMLAFIILLMVCLRRQASTQKYGEDARRL